VDEHALAYRRAEQGRPQSGIEDNRPGLVGIALPRLRLDARVELEHVGAQLLELQPTESVEVVGHPGHSLPRTASARQYSRTTAMSFPQTRLRRLRANRALRGLVRETRLEAADFVYPMFVAHGIDRREPIAEMPGVDHLSIAHAVEEAGDVAALGIPAVLLFGLPAAKDEEGSGAWDEEGIVQLATRAIKDAYPDLLVICDLCLCEYTSHGHCGVLRESAGGLVVDNDATLELLSRTAVSQARAGADIIAPSDMMDGRVGMIRAALDDEGFTDTPIMSYSAKFASAFYGPFRIAADSTPAFGDRRGYQMDPANGDEAVREARLDVEEGADILIVKPALPYLDLIRRIKDDTSLPVAAYNVSGEYSMLKAAAAAGYLDERAAVLEVLTSIRRAGADIIITYHAKDAAEWLQ
jgi:porphobilinogen synthase